MSFDINNPILFPDFIGNSCQRQRPVGWGYASLNSRDEKCVVALEFYLLSGFLLSADLKAAKVTELVRC